MSTITAGNVTVSCSLSADTTGNLVFQSGGNVTAMTIDTSQNVGIGTTPAAGVRLDVRNNSTTTLADMRNANSAGYGIYIAAGGSTSQYVQRWADYNNNALATIDGAGNLLVNTTSATGRFTVSGNASAARVAAVMSNTASDAANAALLVSKFDNVTTTSQAFVAFAVNNNAVASGQINANGASSAAFGAYSDRRLKENIEDLPSQLQNILALRPVEFDYIAAEGGGHQIGFIAQEVQEIYPDLIGERADGMLTLTDLNKNDARLIKAIQEQQQMIETLQAEVAALKGVKA